MRQDWPPVHYTDANNTSMMSDLARGQICKRLKFVRVLCDHLPLLIVADLSGPVQQPCPAAGTSNSNSCPFHCGKLSL